MVEITEAIAVLYPSAQTTDYALRDDGSGPFISFWSDSLGPQPTLADLESVSLIVELRIAKAKLSELRYQKETSGITIGEQFISSERDEIGHWYPRFANAQAWLAGDAMAVGINPMGVYPYKPKGKDPVLLTAQQVIRAYLCLSWFVNACFETEREYGLALDATTSNAEREAILESVVWPQVQYEWEPT